jgi:hypothetical protein
VPREAYCISKAAGTFLHANCGNGEVFYCPCC